MFDSVLRRESLPKRRFGAGAIIAIAVHVGAVGFAFWASATAALRDRQDVEVKFVKPPPPPPPPPPPAAPRESRPKPKLDQPVTVLQQAIVAPTVVPDEKPPEQDPLDKPKSDGVAGELGGAEVGAVPGGIVGGVIDSRDAPLEFDPNKMTESKLIGGPEIVYTEKALEREVQGTMIVKCVLTAEGRVHGCRVVRSLPFMDRAAIDALEKRRYTPVTMGGRPIEVMYTFKVTLRLPN